MELIFLPYSFNLFYYSQRPCWNWQCISIALSLQYLDIYSLFLIVFWIYMHHSLIRISPESLQEILRTPTRRCSIIVISVNIIFKKHISTSLSWASVYLFYNPSYRIIFIFYFFKITQNSKPLSFLYLLEFEKLQSS